MACPDVSYGVSAACPSGCIAVGDTYALPGGATSVRFVTDHLDEHGGTWHFSFRFDSVDGGAPSPYATFFVDTYTVPYTSGWLEIPSGAGAVQMRAIQTTNTRGIYQTVIQGHMEFEGACADACVYGSTSNPTAGQIGYITGALIETVASIALIAAGNPEAIPFVNMALAALIGLPLFAYNCSVGPPPASPLNLTDPTTYSTDNMLEWFQNAAWHYFCKCTDAPEGSPPPTPPDIPEIQLPPDLVGGPGPVTCDAGDICAILNDLMSRILALQNQMNLTRRDVQTIQRQGVPFAYVPDHLFTDLSGNGEIAVSDILALSVQSTTVPPTLSLISADPLEYRFLGRISLGTADGWLRQVMIAHNPHLVLPIEGPITRVGYSLAAGVVANIQTFKMEPLG